MKIINSKHGLNLKTENPEETLELYKLLSDSPPSPEQADYITQKEDEFKALNKITSFFGEVRSCRVCGCTDMNCSVCIEKTGFACTWVQYDLCSACLKEKKTVNLVCHFKEAAGMDQMITFEMDVVIGEEIPEIHKAIISALDNKGWKDYQIKLVDLTYS